MMRVVSSFTGSSEFVLGVMGAPVDVLQRGEVAQHRADIWVGGSVLADDALSSLSDPTFSTREVPPTPFVTSSRVDPVPLPSPLGLVASLRLPLLPLVVRRLSGMSIRRRGSGHLSGRHLQRVLSTEPWHWRPGFFLSPFRIG